MRAQAVAPSVGDVTPVARFALEVNTGTEPLSGSLESDSMRRDFVGWLGLIAAIEAALERAAEEEG